MTDLIARTPPAIAEAMELVQSDEMPIEDRAALYGFLYELQRRINRSLGVRQKGRTAQHELTEYLDRTGMSDLGPLYLSWVAFDVAYPANDAANWQDAGVQAGMADIRENPDTRAFIREVPRHLEIDVAALGEAVHAGNPHARALWDELSAKRWRVEGGKRAVLKVREPKGRAA